VPSGGFNSQEMASKRPAEGEPQGAPASFKVARENGYQEVCNAQQGRSWVSWRVLGWEKECLGTKPSANICRACNSSQAASGKLVWAQHV
jgi:hypothetical protein